MRCTISTDKSNQVVKAAQNLAVHAREMLFFLLPANKMLLCVQYILAKAEEMQRDEMLREVKLTARAALTNKLAIELLPVMLERLNFNDFGNKPPLARGVIISHNCFCCPTRVRSSL